MKCVSLSSQKDKLWIWTAFKQLYAKVKHLKARHFTDDWDVYRQILPTGMHTIGKAYTEVTP